MKEQRFWWLAELPWLIGTAVVCLAAYAILACFLAALVLLLL